MTDAPPDPHRARAFDTLSEMLLTHYVGGAWRAPFSVAQTPLTGAQGQVLGHVVLAGAQDMARARRAASVGQGWDAAAVRAAARTALSAAAPSLAAARQVEGRDDNTKTGLQRPDLLPCGAVILRGDATQDLAGFAAQLDATLAQGRGLIVLSDPSVALSASVLFDALHRAGLPAGSIALLHADPASAQALSAH